MVELKKANACDYIRFVLSALILLFSLTVTSYAIIMQHTGFWKAVPGYVALIIFIVDLLILGIVEGLQIALVELKRQHPDSYKRSHPRAFILGQRAACGDNVERFLMGRQVFVVFLVFFCAKLTTINLEEGEPFLFPAPYWFRAVFLETGILACIVVVIIAQLMPQIVAAKYPVHFLQFFIMRPAYFCCIFVELTGLTHVTWLLSAAFTVVTRMKADDFKIPELMDDGKDILNEVDKTSDSEYLGLEETDNLLQSSIGVKQKKRKVDGAIEGVKVRIFSDGSSKSGSSNDLDTTPLAPSHPRNDSVPHGELPKDQLSRLSELVDHINHAVTPDTLAIIRHHLNTHPEKFAKYPSVIGGKVYPAPQAVAERLVEEGLDVPSFLTDISDEDHVPPHIVACELMAQNRQLRDDIALLRKKMQNM